MANVNSILTKFGESIVSSLDKNLPEKSDATGNLRNSIKFQIKILGSKYIFQLKINDIGLCSIIKFISFIFRLILKYISPLFLS